MILILTEPLDVHADHVAQKLRERGAVFARFNTAQFPEQAEISLLYSAQGQAEAIMHVNQEQIDLHKVESVWYRRPRCPIPHQDITEDLSREYVAGECQNFVDDVWSSLKEKLWIPGPVAVVRQVQLKASHLTVAGALGFELPPTLITNSPEDFLEFYRQHNGHVVSKLAGFSFSRTRSVGASFCRYTEVVTKRDTGYAHAVRYCPIIFQAYVPKRVELRITVVGQHVFAAEIHSQESNHTRHDWRRYDRGTTPYLPHDLSADVELRCIQLVERLGLCYGAIDMVLTPDGRYVFLEINPNGQYLWIEQETGLPISDALCDLLIAGNLNQRAKDLGSSREAYNDQ